jgi:small subunit ribosomal protein S17
MKIHEIRELSTEDLKQRLKDETESLENLRFQRSIGQLENFKSIQNTKKLISRIHTILNDRMKSTENTELDNKAGVPQDKAANDITRGRRKVRVGKVVSTKMDKTIAVEIERRLKHPIYKKYFKKSKKFLAHDESNSAAEGDIVKIMETRPLSAKKRWRLVEIVEKAK